MNTKINYYKKFSIFLIIYLSFFSFSNKAASQKSQKNEIKEKNALGLGNGNTVNGKNSLVFGNENKVHKENSIGLGYDNAIFGKNSSAFGQHNNITKENSSAFGSSNTISERDSAAVGNHNEINGYNNFAFGNNIKTKNKANNSVGLGHGSEITESNVVSVGSKSSKRRITNLADGINDNDAVNVKQLNEKNKNIVSGIAQSMAMANMPQVGENKLFSIGFSSAYYDKQVGFSVGISGTEKTNTFIYKVAAGIDTQKQFSIGAGFNINFLSNISSKIQNGEYIFLENNPYIKSIKDTIDKLQTENKVLKNEVDELRKGINKEKLYTIDQFISNKFNLTSTQMTKLKAIVNEINEKYSDRTIDITGHTDTKHDAKYNLSLGLKRANMISDLMIKLGLKNPQNIRKISSLGFNNIVNGGLSKNRRVEIIIK